MYCTYCGETIEDKSKFCPHCGKQLAQAGASSVNLTVPGLGRRSSSLGSLVVLICFFLPWIFVSCSFGDQGLIKANAFEIATGNYSDLRELEGLGTALGGSGSSSSEDAYPSVFLILLFGLAGFVALRGDSLGSKAAMIAGILGLVGMLIFTLRAFQIRNDLMQGGMSMSFRTGYWGTWLAFIWMTVTGYLGGQKNGP
jgi:hypothetical protein